MSEYTGFLIYGLQDPVSLQIRYVGRSSSGLKRPREHMRPHKLNQKSHKSSWIKSLLSENLNPQIIVLETTKNQANLNFLEKKWITILKDRGFSLVNHTNGGDGTQGFSHSLDSLRKISEASKRNRPVGSFKHSMDTKLKISNNSKNRVQSEETKLRKSLGHKKAPFEAFENGNSIGIFYSRSKFCRDFGIDRRSLLHCLYGKKYKSIKGFTFSLRGDKP